ncbi:MAG: carboxylesterase/lipase family protein [Chitinophagales bacterium]
MKRLLLLGAFLWLCSLPQSAAALDADTTSALVVKTQYGKLRGYQQNGVSIWKGIPYAKAPVGDLRYKAPQPPTSWQGIKDATKYGAIAKQLQKNKWDPQPESEDCLFLNIWSPAADGKQRPVMFWIHGGGFLEGSGSSSLYEGSKLAAKGDVVVVTINYRMGALGFLYFDQMPGGNQGMEANLGLKDQVAALKWVKDNIAAFGGDPNQVTIFGESAGAISVQSLMAAPSAKGLFSKAIVESGAPTDVWTPEFATALTKRYLKTLGVSPDSIAKLKTMPMDTLNQALVEMRKDIIKEPSLAKAFAPTLDGTFLPHDLMTCGKEGPNEVPLLIGTTKNEANLFAMRRLNMAPRTAKQLKPYLAHLDPAARERLLKSYKHFPSKAAILEMITHGIFTMPNVEYASYRCSKAPTYMYRFDWASGLLKMAGLKSCHGLELPFVFGNFDNRLGKLVLLGANKKAVYRISDEMQQAWINFARTGNPNDKGDQEWKPYNTAERSTLVFDKKESLLNDPQSQQRIAWEGINIFE